VTASGTVTAPTGNITTVNATTVGATTGNIPTVNVTTGNITTVNATSVIAGVTLSGNTSFGSLVITGGGGVWVPPIGLYMITPATVGISSHGLHVEVYSGSMWFSQTLSGDYGGGLFYSDGANVRLAVRGSSNVAIYYRKVV
jgi:hypothetical protein